MKNNNTVAIVSKFPKCNIPGCSEKAAYDAKTKLGPWAYLCTNHFKEYGIGLGLGAGQKLALKDN